MEKLKKRFRVYTVFTVISVVLLFTMLGLAILNGTESKLLIFCLFVLFNLTIWSWKVIILKNLKKDRKEGLVVNNFEYFIVYLFGKRWGNRVINSWLLEKR